MSNRVALVTGGAQGIGAGIAQTLGEQKFRVGIADLNLHLARATAESITAAGGRAVAVQADITDIASVQAAVKTVTEELGPVEVVVNNAGWDDFMPFLDTDEEFWDRILDINFKGALRVIKAVVPGMMERGFGRVINIGSDAGRVGSSLEAVYSGAKGGIIAFTKTLALEMAKFNVTANAIAPGFTSTEMVDAIPEEIAAQIKAKIPLGRFATPEEIAKAAAFLAAEGDYITGQELNVNGGYHM